MNANDRLQRSNRDLQRRLDAVHSEGVGGGDGVARGAEATVRKQGDLLQDMALKRRLSAEVEFAKLRLQAALDVDRQLAGSEQAAWGLEQEAPSAREGRGGVSGASGSGVRRCFDLESCAAAAGKDDDRGQEGGREAPRASAGFGWP